MSTVTSRTIYGAAIQARKCFNKEIPIQENTTVNEVLANSAYVPFPPDPVTRGMEVADPYNHSTDSAGIHLGYLILGNNGSRSTTGNATGPAGGITLNTPIEHMATDAGLFNMIPFAVVPVDNDLPYTEQIEYGLRKTMDIAGTLYAAYYCRRLDTTSIQFTELVVNVENGIETPVPFIPASSNLFPQHPVTSGATTGSYVKSTSTIQVTFNELQQKRLIEAARLIYGNPDYAVISEVGFCFGVDKPVKRVYPSAGGNPSTVTNGRPEAVAVQIAIHYTLTPVDIASAKNGLEGAWDVGLSEPLYGIKTA